MKKIIKTHQYNKTENLLTNKSTHLPGKEVISSIAYVPDLKLKRLLNKALGKGPILAPLKKEELGTIKIIESISEPAKVINLEGLQYCKNLKVLCLISNNITDISFIKKLNKLKYINLSDNKIETIDSLSNLKKLEYLILTKNKIFDISPLSDLKNLTYLDLGSNKIEEITFISTLNRLKTLIIPNNKVYKLDALSKLSNLDSLVLNRNKISDLTPLKNLNKLSTLNIHGQLISGNEINTFKNNILVKNIVKDLNSNLIPPSKSNNYSSNKNKILLKNVFLTCDRNYKFSKSIKIGDISFIYDGSVIHKIKKYVEAKFKMVYLTEKELVIEGILIGQAFFSKNIKKEFVLKDTFKKSIKAFNEINFTWNKDSIASFQVIININELVKDLNLSRYGLYIRIFFEEFIVDIPYISNEYCGSGIKDNFKEKLHVYSNIKKDSLLKYFNNIIDIPKIILEKNILEFGIDENGIVTILNSNYSSPLSITI